MRIVLTAGPTREYIDDVRFLSNPSSGRMGFAVAEAAVACGHDVILISGPVGLTPCEGLLSHIRVVSAADMHDAVHAHLADADVVIMSAAVADWTPANRINGKMKKEGHADLSVEFVRTKDILRSIADSKGDRIHVGFAAEAENLEANARIKLESKNLDLVVANDISRADIGFASEENEVLLIGPHSCEHIARAEKSAIAASILKWLEAYVAGQ